MDLRIEGQLGHIRSHYQKCLKALGVFLGFFLWFKDNANLSHGYGTSVARPCLSIRTSIELNNSNE
jgi:hypothetical protein